MNSRTEVENRIKALSDASWLFPSQAAERSSCSKITDSDGKISRDRTIRQFYKVGAYYNQLIKDVRAFNISVIDLSYVSKDVPVFISSAYSMPYPVAAYKEYMSIMSKVCQNDSKRLSIMRSGINREPASVEISKKRALYHQMNESYSVRCKKFK